MHAFDMLATLDSHRTAAVAEGQPAVCLGNDTAGILSIRADCSCHVEISDIGILRIAERCSIIIICHIIVEGQRLAIAFKYALERVALVCANHRRNTQVVD